MVGPRSALPARGLGEWAVRGLLAIVTAWIGYGSVTQSLAYTLRVARPDRAHALAPDNARITALLSAQALQSDFAAHRLARAYALARAALTRDATAVDAVATLGLVAQSKGDGAGARRLFRYSDSLSRRDMRTRLWLIEDAVAHGDVPGALRGYDIALRTSRGAGDLLYPVLSTAIADPNVLDTLVRALATRPPWSSAFVTYATMLGTDLDASATLLLALQRRRIAMPADASAIVIDRLVANQRAVAAWALYRATNPGADARRSRDPGFSRLAPVATAFDWRPVESSGVSASIQRDGDGGIFDFSAAASVGGPVLRQMQALPPGDYLLEGRSAGIVQAADSLPYWSLRCLSGRETGRVALSSSRQNGGRFAGRLTVPANCPIQYLELILRSSDDVAGTSGQISRAALRPDTSAGDH